MHLERKLKVWSHNASDCFVHITCLFLYKNKQTTKKVIE